MPCAARPFVPVDEKKRQKLDNHKLSRALIKPIEGLESAMAVVAAGRWIGGAHKTSTARMEDKSRAGVRLRARIWRWRCLSSDTERRHRHGSSGRAETSRGKIGAGRVMGLVASSRLLAVQFWRWPPPDLDSPAVATTVLLSLSYCY